MNRFSQWILACVAVAALFSAGCDRRDDPMTSGAPGAGPGTTSAPADSTMAPMPPASAASR